MALDDLLAELERDARSKADAELAAARAEASRIAGDGVERIRRRRAEFLASLEADLEAETELALAEARHRVHGEVLAARQRMLERVFAAARERLADAVRSEAYDAVLGSHLAEALSYLGGAAAVVRCPAALASRVRELVAGREHLSVDSRDGAEPGIAVVAAEGAVVVDNTLTGRLERLRGRLAIEVLARSGVEP
ncbi:MAG: hypothetical protein HYY35_05735 [Deltaproteobacteria bacterium]|nr:hypothetical protein [Deltaproteobacteria bacterium]